MGITKSTPTIINEFIKKIFIHAPEKLNGKRFQKVDIVFNFVGEIHLPTDPQTEIYSVPNKRQSYEYCFKHTFNLSPVECKNKSIPYFPLNICKIT